MREQRWGCPMKKCPYCAELVQDDAVVCKHCGRSIRARAPLFTANVPGHQIAGLLIAALGMLTTFAGVSPGGGGTVVLIGWLLAWGGLAYSFRGTSAVVRFGGSFILSLLLLVLAASCRG